MTRRTTTMTGQRGHKTAQERPMNRERNPASARASTNGSTCNGRASCCGSRRSSRSARPAAAASSRCACGRCVPDVSGPSGSRRGVALSLVQWWAQRFIGRAHTANGDPLGRRRWIAVNALCAGAFWGITSLVLFPAGSVEHQLLLVVHLAGRDGAVAAAVRARAGFVAGCLRFPACCPWRWVC